MAWRIENWNQRASVRAVCRHIAVLFDCAIRVMEIGNALQG